jgi:uncharacterized membrane protein HdeD (DUF308 family)
MSTLFGNVATTVDQAKKAWGWYLALGIFMIAIGIYAIWSGWAGTLASIFALGIVLFVAGIAQIISAFSARGAGHVILALLVGVLDIVVGLMLFEHPGLGAVVITLFLSVLFVFGGVFRLISALWLQFPHYGWVAFSAVITFLLGVLLWVQWPISAVWFPGLAVGINLMFAGIAWAAMGWNLKSA